MEYRLKEVPIDSIRVWAEAQARDLDEAGIEDLAQSIKSDGLQSPPLVQRDGDDYTLISGQRRLAACRSIGMKTIKALVLDREQDVVGAKTSSLIENLQRSNMSGAEISRAVRFLVDRDGREKTCENLGISNRTMERYLGFDAVPSELKAMVPDQLARDEAVRLMQATDSISRAVDVAGKISRYDKAKRVRYIKALADNPDDTHAQLVRKSNKYYNKNLKLDLSGMYMARLANKADELELTVEELVSDIVSEWLGENK